LRRLGNGRWATNIFYGKLQLVIDDHDIRGPQAAMHESFLVKIGQRVEDWAEHLLHFGRRKRSLGQYLRKDFAGILRYDVKNCGVVDAIAARAKDANEVRMTELGAGGPIGCA
jgi:hypothetical protein